LPGHQNLLSALAASASTDPVTTLILLSIPVKEDTLSDMVHALKDNVGLVHQMPFVCDREGFAGILEKVL